MILSNLFSFTVVVIAVWLNMAITKAIAGILLDDEKATIAAFAFALGTITGVPQTQFFVETEIGMWVGIVVAFAGLWWVHFGRVRQEAVND